MSLTLAPYGEKVISDYLRDQPDVEAIVGRRVVGKTPTSTDEPWIRVTQLDDANEGASTEHEHLHGFWFQLDCYAGADGGQPEANLLVRTVRAALVEMQRATLADVVVSRVTFTSQTRIPDQDVDEPARERFVLDTRIYMRPD